MTGDAEGVGHANHLVAETSPYLLQHAHNPVNWYPWGTEALTRAQSEDRAILLSIGYSACHWCHVMERESFENEAIAALMNEHFVCIKVDREERPDLDEIYMAATLALNHGQGGWPMTVFLTPAQKPFFAGTYFPPEERYGRVGFGTILQRIATLWRENRRDVEAEAARLSDALRGQLGPTAPLAVPVAEIEHAAAQLAKGFDPVCGGFGPAPKFPQATVLALLLRHHRRTGDAHALHMVRTTLDGMARGGMYDHAGGGFARYSTDERWLVPHFEKMLYDNALLAKLYVEAYQVTEEPAYRRVAVEVLDYVLCEMTGPEGGFFSAMDADSDGEEGKFYVWRPAEIDAVLGPEEGRRFRAYYDITDEGNWEGKSILHTPRSLEEVAVSLGLSPDTLRRSLEAARPRVCQARRRRVPLALDDKILTAWNGLMIGAMAEGYRVLGDRRYLQAAERAADFVLTTLVRPDGGLLRTYRAGKAHLEAYLEDYAYLCEACIDVYESGGAPRYLMEAERLGERLLRDFGDDGGAFYGTARDHEALLVRYRDGKDGAIPSANAVAAHALARLSYHFGRRDFRDAAIAAIQAYGAEMAQYPLLYAKALAVVDFLAEGPTELALIGVPGDDGFEALRRAVGARYLPNRIVQHRDPGTQDGEELPLLAGKGLVDGQAALYVCRNFACQAPVTTPTAAAEMLTASRQQGEERGIVGGLCPGWATPEGTAAHAARHRRASRETAYSLLGSTGLTISRLGFGGYRIDDQTAPHREALKRALGAGINLIDTSTNYTDGASERAIGVVLAGRIHSGETRREDVVVVSKIGYVQGRQLARAQQREEAGRAFPGMVKYADGCWHCIHPAFLRDQLQRSLARLGLETLDVCLLHNPEYFLADAHRRGRGPLSVVRDEFYERVREAFRFFEGQIAAGTIRWYGVSSNKAAAPATDPEATSLSRILDVAREVGGSGHHCRVLQLPMNLFEAGPILEHNNGTEAGETVLDCAARNGIGVLLNRPLNAMVGGGMIRVADVPDAGTDVDIGSQRGAVAALEEEFRRDLAPTIQTAPESTRPEDFFRWAERLGGLQAQLQSVEQWRQIEAELIVPSVMHLVRALDGAFSGPRGEHWSAWRDRYLPELRQLLMGFHGEAARKSRATSAAVAALLDPLLAPARRGETLSRKALWVLVSTPGVSCVLNGMRDPIYVEDAVGVLAWPAADAVEPIYRALRAAGSPQPVIPRGTS